MPITLDNIVGNDLHVAPQRDRYGRYLIPNPDTGELIGVPRATTIAKTLDDQTNLTNWKGRSVALGVAKKPSLAAGIIAAQDDRKALDALVEQALEAAGGNERRELGTHLHRIVELVDLGRMHVADVPEPWRADVTAYLAALDEHGLTVIPELTEVILLNHPLGIAGTADRVYGTRDGRLVIGDLKTGTFLSWLAFAAQLAIYATSTHVWNPAESTLTQTPDMRQDIGLIVHLPAGEGRCTIHAVDLAPGMDAVLMALEVRRIRKLDHHRHIVVENWQQPEPETEPTVPARTVKHTFSTNPAAAVARRPVVTDEGPTITPAQVAEIKHRVANLNPDARHTLELLAKDGAAVGKPWSIGAGPVLRRWHVYRALLRLAAHHGADLTAGHVRATLALVIPDAAHHTVALGPAIGSLNLDDAMTFVRAAIAVIAAPNPTLTIDDDGTVTWAGVDTTAV